MKRNRFAQQYFRERAKCYDFEPSRDWADENSSNDKINSVISDFVISVSQAFKHPTLLELGVGTGRILMSVLSFLLNSQLPFRKLIGLDISKEMLDVLSSKLSNPDEHRTHLILGDACCMPLRSHSVNAITCFSVFHYLNPRLATNEIARILKPHGELLLGTVCVHEQDTEDWRNSFRDLVGSEYSVRFQRKSDICAHFESKGFETVGQYLMIRRRKFKDLIIEKREYWGEVRVNRVVRWFLGAPMKQKLLYAIEQDGYNQYYHLLRFRKQNESDK